MRSQSFRSFWFRTGALVIGLLWILLLRQAFLPRIIPLAFSVDLGERHQFAFPLIFPSQGRDIVVETDVHLPLFGQPVFDLRADDCLQQLDVNGANVEDIGAPFCEGPKRVKLPLHPGRNRIAALVRDFGGAGGFSLAAARTDPAAVFLSLLAISLCVWYIWTFRKESSLLRRFPGSVSVVLGGILLRWMYVLVTPLSARTHDWDKHVDYIRYVAQHASIPPVSQGLEFHQSPLYYFLSAAWLRAGEFFGRAFATMLLDLQRGSFLLSAATLLVAAWIAWQLFPEERRPRSSVLFLAIVSVLPGIVYYASVVTNDPPACFMAFLAFAFLLRWWRTRRTSHWIVFSLVLGAGLLTKSTLLPMVGAALLTLAAASLRLRRKALLGFSLVLILFLMTGWMYAFRLLGERTTIIGNPASLDPTLQLHQSVRHTVRFHPLKVLAQPYVNPNGNEEEKEFFLEYLFRSAFLGEYRFPDALATDIFLMLLFGMVAMLFAFIGVVREGWQRRNAPVTAVLVLEFLLVAVGRLTFPYSVMQDFRFIPLFAVPLAYYAVRGAEGSPLLLRRLGMSVLWGLVLSCTLFFLRLFFFGG